jgi:cob(I)alamin adenosyltransferase
VTPYFTGRGDEGYTGLLGEERVPKFDLRLETLGALDEATAALGIARAICKLPASRKLILRVQRDLYMLMAETAAPPETAEKFHRIDARYVTWLEEQIEALGQAVTMPEEFIVPGDTWVGAVLDLARAIVRRAERRLAELFHRGDLKNLELLKYTNRLSTLLFFIELLENQTAGENIPTLAKTEQDDRNFD